MKRAVGFSIGVFGVAAMFVWAGCAFVIDLGDEAKLAPADASGTLDSASADVETDRAVEEFTCGLPPLVDPACRACSESRCCGEIEACSKEPGCPEGITCIQDCMGQYGCVFACLGAGSQTLRSVVDCSSLECPECTPKPDCQKLGACASLLDPDAGALLRQTARSAILELNEENCTKWRLVIREELAKLQPDVDAGACYP